MIDAKELRIGNYVNYEGTTHVLTGLINNDVCSSEWTSTKTNDSYHHRYVELKPIPLTEEILLKCGFEYNTKDWLELKYKNLTFNTDRSVNMSVVYLNVCNDWLEIECLHQLQNLYFSLTEKELEVNL